MSACLVGLGRLSCSIKRFPGGGWSSERSVKGGSSSVRSLAPSLEGKLYWTIKQLQAVQVHRQEPHQEHWQSQGDWTPWASFGSLQGRDSIKTSSRVYRYIFLGKARKIFGSMRQTYEFVKIIRAGGSARAPRELDPT